MSTLCCSVTLYHTKFSSNANSDNPFIDGIRHAFNWKCLRFSALKCTYFNLSIKQYFSYISGYEFYPPFQNSSTCWLSRYVYCFGLWRHGRVTSTTGLQDCRVCNTGSHEWNCCICFPQWGYFLCSGICKFLWNLVQFFLSFFHR